MVCNVLSAPPSLSLFAYIIYNKLHRCLSIYQCLAGTWETLIESAGTGCDLLSPDPRATATRAEPWGRLRGQRLIITAPLCYVHLF